MLEYTAIYAVEALEDDGGGGDDDDDNDDLSVKDDHYELLCVSTARLAMFFKVFFKQESLMKTQNDYGHFYVVYDN